MTRPDFTDPTGVEGDYTTPADGSHVKTTTQVKTLGNTNQYPNTEAGVKAVLRSEVDAEMSGAHNSLWGILGNLLNGIGEVLSGIAGPALGLLGNIATGLISGVVNLLGGIVSTFSSVLNRKPIPVDTPEIFSSIAADLEGELEPFMEQVDNALATAKASTKASEELGEKMAQEFDPEWEDSAMWKMQMATNEASRQAEEALGVAVEANANAIGAMSEYIQRMHHVPDGTTASNEHWQATRNGSQLILTAKPGWTGTAIFLHAWTARESTGSTNAAGDRHDHNYDNSKMMVNSQIMRPGGYRTFASGDVVVHYNVSPGTPRVATPTGSNLQLDNNVWTTLMSWRVPKDTKMSASAAFTWAAKTWGGSYGSRLRLDGKTVSNTSTSASAPLFGHGPRSAKTASPPMSAKEGQILTLEAYAKHGNPVNRVVSSPSMRIDWIEPPAAEE